MNELIRQEREIDARLAQATCPKEIESLLQAKMQLIDSMGY